MGLLMGQKLVTSGTDGVQNCGSHTSETTGWIQSILSSRLVVVQWHNYFHSCLMWACPWATNLSNLIPPGLGPCGAPYLETTGWIYSILSSMEVSTRAVVQRYVCLPTWPIWSCPWTRTNITKTAGQIFSLWSSMELSRCVVGQHHGHWHIWPAWVWPWSPIRPIWACP